MTAEDWARLEADPRVKISSTGSFLTAAEPEQDA